MNIQIKDALPERIILPAVLAESCFACRRNEKASEGERSAAKNPDRTVPAGHQYFSAQTAMSGRRMCIILSEFSRFLSIQLFP